MCPTAADAFMFDRKAECMPRTDLAALQLTRMKQTLAQTCAKLPHVRAKFDAGGVKPGHLKTLADLARFPFASKADPRDSYPFGLFAVPREQIRRIRRKPKSANSWRNTRRYCALHNVAPGSSRTTRHFRVVVAVG